MKVKLRVKVEQKIRARVRRGARALDKVYPDWFRQSHISLSRLDQTNGCQCVWGQLQTGRARADEAFQRAFTGEYPAYNATVDSFENLGYYPGDENNIFVSEECNTYPETDEARRLRHATQDAEWRVLQDEWETQIRLRRRAAGVRAAA